MANVRYPIESQKIPERIYQVYLFGLCHALCWKGWEATIEPRGGSDYVDICLVSKTLRSAVLIVLKSSKQKQDIKKDVVVALGHVGNDNYRNLVGLGLANVQRLREYGIASYGFELFIKGHYLELSSRNESVEKDDPAMET